MYETRHLFYTKFSFDYDRATSGSQPHLVLPGISTHCVSFACPFSDYFNALSRIDKGKRYSDEYGSILILSLVEEVGEIARAYLAEHGRKPNNKAAQRDETYEQELGDLVVTILRFARIKDINLDEYVKRTLAKIEARKSKPKE
jgi:NTP pyrophosphatase (non-canonical NTP hydrolase)